MRPFDFRGSVRFVQDREARLNHGRVEKPLPLNWHRVRVLSGFLYKDRESGEMRTASPGECVTIDSDALRACRIRRRVEELV